jgi:sarcosine oxidase gamma subunit
MRPGSIQRPLPTGAILLIAPARWLLMGDALSSHASELALLRERGASLVDVSAKWCRFEFAAARAHECLSRVIDLAQVMGGGRDCAALTVLDCPAVLLRSGAGYELWVMRSFAEWLHQRLIALPGWPAG